MNIRVLGNNLEAWTLAAVLASTGCRVVIAAKQLPDEHSELAELDLLRLLQKQLAQGRLQLIDLADTVFNPADSCELLIDARTNLSAEQRFQALQMFSDAVQAESAIYALVQPVAVGTTDQLQCMLLDACKGRETKAQIDCLYWPSFIEAGRALESFTRSGRLLIGASRLCQNPKTEGDIPEGVAAIRELMAPFNRSKDAAMVMSAREAELTKIGINGMLATRISFMNELADIASRQGVDIEAVRQGIGADPRIGHQYLYPGCGFGGEAFTDTLGFLGEELEATESAQGLASGLLSSVWQINEQQKDLLFQKFWRYFNAEIKGRTVALWGCAFKPNTASIAGSPALVLIQALLSHGVQVQVYDPMAMESLKLWLNSAQIRLNSEQKPDDGQVVFCDSPEQAAEQADAIMLVTEWKLFWNLNLTEIATRMKTPLLLDGRNIYPPKRAQQAGFVYSAIGRGQTI
ncbi:nucleotide sugar dehydrogenase [Oceanospirillum sanctuarii]|uniref:nucleotide sugar dehydrogenase n=1 Tax=Oceanospirillum sanctuarii TaxID=1434821 RepID=UPI000A3A3D6F|nr:nucleotide sugar dehydrogenase [Oceanospirillum sanctuarii]